MQRRLQHVFVYAKGFAQILQDGGGALRDLGRVADVVEDERELTPGQARDGVRLTRGVCQSGRHLAQQAVADLMPETVVQPLEMTHAERDQGEPRAAFARRRARLAEALVEQRAVGQARERVIG